MIIMPLYGWTWYQIKITSILWLLGSAGRDLSQAADDVIYCIQRKER
ncbi:hypothetical protein ANACOL_04237 [Anaerotruncus colihominis DSM 17241]|uniref:Uncharacterized protein n=1 Tax=Anaerotruncus colihominis DSM 17241 TaxID=445972 RepID=B0PHE4_9FIRM|nr:hypothetical protein ANACOL_04237 [Anaerotruncus colihominis DSM 17241]